MEATSKAEARKHNLAYIVRICCIAALGGILLGYDTAVISGAIGPIREYFGLSPAQTGWAVSSVVLGSIIGAVSAGWAALKYGRRNTLFIAAILFIISAIGSAPRNRLHLLHCSTHRRRGCSWPCLCSIANVHVRSGAKGLSRSRSEHVPAIGSYWPDWCVLR